MPRVFNNKGKEKVDDESLIVWGSPKVSSSSSADVLLEKYLRKKRKKESEGGDVDTTAFRGRRRRLHIVETDISSPTKKDDDVFSRIRKIAAFSREKKRKKKKNEIEMYDLRSRVSNSSISSKIKKKRSSADRFETWGRSVRSRHKPKTTVTTTTTTTKSKSRKRKQNSRKLSDVLRHLGDREKKKSHENEDERIEDVVRSKNSVWEMNTVALTAAKSQQFDRRKRQREAVIVDTSPSRKKTKKDKTHSWKLKLASTTMNTPQRSKQTPSPNRKSTLTRGGKRMKQTPRGKALRQAMKHCGTGPISSCLKKVFRNLESDLSMFVHTCQTKKNSSPSSSFDMRQHRGNVDLRISNPCVGRCKTHLICECDVIRTTDEKKIQSGTLVSVILKQSTLERLHPNNEILSKDAIIRLYEPYHLFKLKSMHNNRRDSALLCTDLCEYSDVPQ